MGYVCGVLGAVIHIKKKTVQNWLINNSAPWKKRINAQNQSIWRPIWKSSNLDHNEGSEFIDFMRDLLPFTDLFT